MVKVEVGECQQQRIKISRPGVGFTEEAIEPVKATKVFRNGLKEIGQLKKVKVFHKRIIPKDVNKMAIKKQKSLAVEPVKAMPVANDATVAEQFRAQLGRVAEAEQNSLKQRVILGAMLIKWERYLGSGQGRKGEGLMSWLEENLPELNYNSAQSYKQMAVKFLDMMGGGEMALEAMAGGETVTNPAGETVEIEAEIIEKRDEIFAAADSRRKLEQMWFDFSGEGPKKKGKAGRPKGSKAQYQGYQGEALQPAQAARALWSKVIEPAMDAGLGAAAKLLEVKDVADALAVLEPLVSILKQRKSEF